MAKFKAKYSFTTDIDGNQKVYMPGEAVDQAKLDAKFFEGMKARGFIVQEKEVISQAKTIPGAVEFKETSIKSAEAVMAKPEPDAPVKVEEVKEEIKSAGTPIVEQPQPRGRANRKN